MSTLFCFGFQGGWEQDDTGWRYFLWKILNKISVWKGWFSANQALLFIAEMGKASSKNCEKQGSFCTTKTFIYNRWTAMWFASDQKWPAKQKSLISTPELSFLHTKNECFLVPTYSTRNDKLSNSQYGKIYSNV